VNYFLCKAATLSESAVAFFMTNQCVSDAGGAAWRAEEGLELVGYEATFYETA